MTQEDKELLLKDICARLPYGVNIQVYYEDIAGSGYFDETVWSIDNDEPFHVNDRLIENIKPYLRTMSSMTEEELTQYKCMNDALDENYEVHIDNAYPAFDWCNSHYFDYRGLIERGLAIEAPKDMYNIN